jgi:uncharacterized protein YndB with AHSA1/START domain
MKPAEVTLPSDTVVRVARSFDAPARLVWRAYTEPKLMPRWLGGYPGWTMPVCEMDVRPGGKFRWRWKHEDGKEFGFHGEYKEVTPHTKIVNTEFFDPGSMGGDMGDGALITVEFVEKGGATTMISTIEYTSKQARDAALSTGMTDGMEVSYQQLDKLLESTPAG